MTQENKDLLLRDLCARLPYGVEVYYTETVPISTLKTINLEKGTCIVYDHSQWYRHSKLQVELIKPYLRPMSSITEEERKEKLSFFRVVELNSGLTPLLSALKSFEYINWLNAHHFDYHGLIEKGLALEAQEGMYNLNY